MTNRDRLIELFKKTEYTPFPEMTMKSNLGNQFTEYALNCIVDDLLANGVILPPCKVGDKVYIVSRYYAGDWEIYQCEIESITCYKKNTFISCFANDVRFGKINFGLNNSEIGKTVFLTKEEAEAELKKRGKENDL